MNNMEIYNIVRSVPGNAQKKISGGRLNGKTDINPMWRIKILTEIFGACGIGWKYEITKQWIEPGSNGEFAAFCNINLYIKNENEWSGAIPGTGGSMFVAKERSGLYTSDECYKMALTDAISVACKALGIGADIYWQADRTKYSEPPEEIQQQQKIICPECGKEVKPQKKKDGTIVSAQDVFNGCGGKCFSCWQKSNNNQ